MKIRIKSKSNGFTPGPVWWDNHIGEVFEVLRRISGIPDQFSVDISRLVESGEISDRSSGIGYIPVSMTEEISANGWLHGARLHDAQPVVKRQKGKGKSK